MAFSLSGALLILSLTSTVAGGEPGYLGLRVGLRGDTLRIAAVTARGPADRAGVKAGDGLLELDHCRVTSNHELQRLLDSRFAGTEVTLKLLRAGSELSIPIRLEPRPQQIALDKTPETAVVERPEPQLTTPIDIRDWYGWQTLISDAASGTVMIVGAAADSAPVIIVGLAGWVLAGPIIHGVNGQPLRGLASGGLRIAAPVVSALTLFALVCGLGDCNGEDNWSGALSIGVGILGGAAASSAIDAALLARKSPEEADDPDFEERDDFDRDFGFGPIRLRGSGTLAWGLSGAW